MSLKIRCGIIAGIIAGIIGDHHLLVIAKQLFGLPRILCDTLLALGCPRILQIIFVASLTQVTRFVLRALFIIIIARRS